MSARAVGLIVVLVTLSAAACGVRTGDGVDIADADDVPFGLLEPDRAPIAGSPEGSAVIDVFFLDRDQERLVPVTRRVRSAGVQSIVAELEAGPSDAESSLGLHSALTDVEVISTVDVDGSTATVDLAGSFTELSGADQLTAIAQLVLSLTQRPGIDQVAITVDGDRVEVPRADGTLTSDALDRRDYESIAEP